VGSQTKMRLALTKETSQSKERRERSGRMRKNTTLLNLNRHERQMARGWVVRYGRSGPCMTIQYQVRRERLKRNSSTGSRHSPANVLLVSFSKPVRDSVPFLPPSRLIGYNPRSDARMMMMPAARNGIWHAAMARLLIRQSRCNGLVSAVDLYRDVHGAHQTTSGC
jgi:hypothetical protein